MKLPNVLTIRQAVTLAVGCAVIAVFLKLFAPLAVGLLMALAFLSGAYAAVLKWAPEHVADKPK